MSSFSDVFAAGLEQVRKSWGWFLGFGILLSILGIVCVGKAQTATTFSILALGWVLMISGVLWLLIGLWGNPGGSLGVARCEIFEQQSERSCTLRNCGVCFNRCGRRVDEVGLCGSDRYKRFRRHRGCGPRNQPDHYLRFRTSPPAGWKREAGNEARRRLMSISSVPVRTYLGE
jgi:hypothetical protein